MSHALAALAQDAKAWPFEQARALRARLERLGRLDGRVVLFETGYGPSGLPHIGTFGEVARTTMVRNAFRTLTGDTIPTKLLAFSDDSSDCNALRCDARSEFFAPRPCMPSITRLFTCIILSTLSASSLFC